MSEEVSQFDLAPSPFGVASVPISVSLHPQGQRGGMAGREGDWKQRRKGIRNKQREYFQFIGRA